MPNPFAHIELTTDDLKAAQKFYSKVFGWKLNEMPGMSYTMIDVGGGTGGGMQSKPLPDAPTGWVPYVQVDDVKAAIAKATKAGGTVMLAYQDIGDMGAIGVFADPDGAVIGVWESAAAAVAAPSVAVERLTKPKLKKKGSTERARDKKARVKNDAAGKRAAAPAKKAPASKKGAPRASQAKAPAKKKKRA